VSGPDVLEGVQQDHTELLLGRTRVSANALGLGDLGDLGGDYMVVASVPSAWHSPLDEWGATVQRRSQTLSFRVFLVLDIPSPAPVAHVPVALVLAVPVPGAPAPDDLALAALVALFPKCTLDLQI
jgi:hypothetical protein